MKKNFYLMLVLSCFISSCSNDFEFDRNTVEKQFVTDDDFFAQLEVLDLMYQGSEESILVPNGECLIGAIMSAGEQLGVKWNYAIVRNLTQSYLGNPSVDMEGQIIGYNTSLLTLKKFLGTFFEGVYFLPLNINGLEEKLGKEFTAIGLLEDKTNNTSHAYNIQSKCNKHKPDCFICYDPVTGRLEHLQASSFKVSKCFLLRNPKRVPSSRNNE